LNKHQAFLASHSCTFITLFNKQFGDYFIQTKRRKEKKQKGINLFQDNIPFY